MDELCVEGNMSLESWIRMGATLGLEGLEFYAGFLDLQDKSRWRYYRDVAGSEGLTIPMLCCSPDFTWPGKNRRAREIDRQKRWMDMASTLGARFCRVLSGQARPVITRTQGLNMVTDAIEECLEYAAELDIVLILENHYKDNYWEYPEFAQSLDIFHALLEKISNPRLGVNFDPSNAILAGDDPIEWLNAVLGRVVTMHASDRFLVDSKLPVSVENLCHGEIGCGLVDYPLILSRLKGCGFEGWISIEDGVEGMDQLHRSVEFLTRQIEAIWTENE